MFSSPAYYLLLFLPFLLFLLLVVLLLFLLSSPVRCSSSLHTPIPSCFPFLRHFLLFLHLLLSFPHPLLSLLHPLMFHPIFLLPFFCPHTLNPSWALPAVTSFLSIKLPRVNFSLSYLRHIPFHFKYPTVFATDFLVFISWMNFKFGHFWAKYQGYSLTFWPNMAHFHHFSMCNQNEWISNLVIFGQNTKAIALLFGQTWLIFITFQCAIKMN